MFSLFQKHSHIGCNINDRSIELVKLDPATSPVAIVAKARAELAPGTIVNGQIKDDAAFRRAIRSIRAQAGVQEKDIIHITLSITEQLVFPFTITQSLQSNPQQLHALIHEEAKKHVPFSEKFQRIFAIKETVNQHIVFAYAIDSRVLQPYEQLLTEEGIRIDHVEPDSIALARFVLPHVTTQQLVTLIDIGTEITHIITIQNGFPILSQYVPVGAETLKKSTKMYKLSGKKIPQAVKGYAKDVSIRISRAQEFVNTGKNAPHHAIRVFGGGSLLPHLSEIIEQEAKAVVTPGTLGQVFKTGGITNRDVPVFAHAIGSALRTVSHTIGRELIELDALPAAKSTPQFPSLTHIKKRVTAGLVGILVIILVVASGLIIYHSFKAPAPANPQTNADLQNGSNTIETFRIDLTNPVIVPAISYIEKTGEEKTTVQTTGIDTTTGFAEGMVRLYNTSSFERPLVKNTRLSTSDGLIFRIQKDIVIPANGSIDVQARADQEGASGDISQGVRLSVPGLSEFNQQYTYAETQENFSGGIHTVHIVDEHDIQQAQTTLTDLLLARFKKEFAENQTAINQIVPLEKQNTITTHAEPAIGTESSQVKVNVSIVAPAISVSKATLEALANEHLQGRGTLRDVQILSATYDPATKTGSASASIQFSN